MTYDEFIRAKMPLAKSFGFEPKLPIPDTLKPHQGDVAQWMVRGGRRACFKAFGLGKTRTHIHVAAEVLNKERNKKKYLIIAPLGVRQEFFLEGKVMGKEMEYCRNDDEIKKCKQRLIITNYERVRDGNITINPEVIAGSGLDEASILRGYGTKTYQTFLNLFENIPYRFVFTATPSPNRHKELIHYGGFLGIMQTGEALTRFFQRDSQKAGNLTLYPHMEEKFWLWLSSWAVFMQKPSDLGYSDEGYDLPPMNVHWHRLEADHRKAWNQFDSWGQAQLILDKSSGLPELAEVKRETILQRLQFADELMQKEPSKHWLLWHDLEAERHMIEKVLPHFKTAYGNQDLEEREKVIRQFCNGEIQHFATKPVIAGSGTNMQKHCADAIFLGSTFKFNDFIQACHRVYRFLQDKQVNIHIIYSESEDHVIETLKRKWREHDELVAKMVALLKKFKLSLKPDMQQLTRGLGTDRKEVSSDTFKLVHNDSVIELMQPGESQLGESGKWPNDCVDLIVTSIPFGNQYEYSPHFQDMGHNPSNEEFFKQLDYLAPNLLRVLKPGRLACFHVKDRIRFGNVTGLGFPTVDRFSDKAADLLERHGFHFIGRITIDTDVVRENNQTYRLGWTENSKDSSKMGVGMSEYVMLLRKKPTDLSDAYADTPVTKKKSELLGYKCPDCGVTAPPDEIDSDEEKKCSCGGSMRKKYGITDDCYSRSQWQIDADDFWKSNGNRLPAPEVMLELSMETIGRIWRKHCMENRYDYNAHVQIGIEMERLGKLPASFMLFPPISKNPAIWTDIARMRVLNSEQSKRHQENHVCLARGSMVLVSKGDKPIEQIEIGDLVFTHKAQWKPVIAKQMTGINPTIRIFSAHVQLRLTPTHKVWAVSDPDSEPTWIEAQNLHHMHVKVNGFWEPILKIEAAEPCETWNIRVAEDESYTAEGCVVKNCPLQLDICDRLINRYSNKGEIVYDPFAGIGTVPYRAIHLGRKGWGSELSEDYWHCAVGYCEQAEAEHSMPTLFDLAKELKDAI